MTFVVTESCIACKYTDCVEVCPMDCFYEGPNFLVINPDECIDCSMCVAECPVNAIVGEAEIALTGQAHFIRLNRVLSLDPQWMRITSSKSPLAEHDRWAKVESKVHMLQLEPIAIASKENSSSGMTEK